MKNFVQVNILVILGISLVLLLNIGGSSIYGQNFTNQTSGQNATQQQLDQANQQKQQAQQQIQQTRQEVQQANQTQQQQANQSKQQDPKMNEKLLNYTNAAILALNDDNTDAAQSNLALIQTALINETDKQVIVVSTPAGPSTDESDDGSD
jgi:acetate kinase